MAYKVDLNDPKVIEGCRKNKPKYQKLVFETLYGAMYAVCMRYANDEDQASDLVQEGFIKVFGSMDKYQDSGSFVAWIKRVMVNNAIDFCRQKKDHFRVDVHDNFELSDDDANLNEFEFEDVEFTLNGVSVQDIVDALQQLSPQYQAVFNMYVMENFTHKEIAAYLDISEGTSKSNLAKAKRNILKLVEDKLKV